MWKIFSVPCGSALYKFHCISSFPSPYVQPAPPWFHYSNGVLRKIQIMKFVNYIQSKKNAVLWDVASCGYIINRRFEGGDTFLGNVYL
jgi:hypothetical protein